MPSLGVPDKPHLQRDNGGEHHGVGGGNHLRRDRAEDGPGLHQVCPQRKCRIRWIQILYQDGMDLMDSDSFVLFNKEK